MDFPYLAGIVTDSTITTRVFKSGNSQAVRIPNDLWIAAYAMAMDLTLITK